MAEIPSTVDSRAQPSVNSPLRKVAIDLTLMLPGGANGGAKVFIFHLVRDLARIAPACEFLLLTDAATHAELASLESHNVRRVLVAAPQPENASLSLRSMARKVFRRLPRRSKTLLADSRMRYLARAPRRLVNGLGHQLLFCPFTAPTLHIQTVPTVCTIYDLQYKEYPQFFDADELKQRDTAFVDAVRYASTLAAISEYSRQSALACGKIEPDRIVTIWLRLARRVQMVSAERCQTVLSDFGLDYGRYLLYPANFWPHKNHEMLLQSFALAQRLGLASDIKLVLTGSAEPRQHAVSEMRQALGLENDVIIPGFVEHDQFAALLNGCTGVVFPSLFEGFGLPIIEAMAVGKPVACSRATSLPEIAANAALMFDPRAPPELAAAMMSLTSDQPLRQRLIAAGTERARAFQDSTQMAREYWALFESSLVADR